MRRPELSLQTTLLGIAVAIIVALVAALVGPLMIDWGGYRALFEQEATRLIGAPVHVTGAIDARLLPTPQLTLHDVEFVLERTRCAEKPWWRAFVVSHLSISS